MNSITNYNPLGSIIHKLAFTVGVEKGGMKTAPFFLNNQQRTKNEQVPHTHSDTCIE